jgi:hypothetical protein
VVSGTLIFPDFELVHRHDSSRRWLLEIIGFWTPEYLARKLEQLKQTGIDNLLVCIDAKRCCANGELPQGAHLIRYRRHINPRDVLAVIEPS